MQQWFLVLVLVSLSGCASLSRKECLDADATSWEGVGYEDGYNGYEPEQRLSQHYQACSRMGVLPHRESYMTGWSQGILTYCTPERGYAIGLSGSRGNPAVCPGDAGMIFQENIELGLRIYELQGEVDSVSDEIEDLEKKLDDARLDYHARRQIRERLRHRDDEMAYLRWRLMEAQSSPLIRF